MLEPQFQEMLSLGDLLSPWRKKAWDRFRELGSLELRQEAFRYVPVQQLVLPQAATFSHQEIASKREYRIVFIDGFYSAEQSVLPEDVICLPLEEAMSSYGVFLHTRLAKSLQEETDPFAALNGAFQGKGAFVYVPSQIHVDCPIYVEYFFTSPHMATPRLTVHVGKRSHLKMVHEWHMEDFAFSNSHVDISLDEEATLSSRTIQKGSDQGHLFHSWRVTNKRASSFTFRLYGEGAAISRYSMRVQLLEEESEALLEGVAKLEGARHHHIHATVEHCAEKTKSRQHFKSLLKDQSCASFEGKIYVHPEAQKTESYQLNNSLLLSDLATSYAKPNLEVLADDVKASHGSTVAQLDEETLFYLRSRGLSLAEAQQYAIEGFLEELKECLP